MNDEDILTSEMMQWLKPLADKVEIRRTVTLNLTANDWQLYTTMDALVCATVAAAINRAIEKAVSNGGERAQVEVEARAVMRKYAKYGALDTEPRGVLDDVLNLIFPEVRG